MNEELKNTQNESSKNDLILTLIAKREYALNLIKTSKNHFVCRDRYKQVKNIEKQLKRLGVNI